MALGNRYEMSQALGIVILGGGLGLFLALVEQALRRAWVQVQSGRQEGRDLPAGPPTLPARPGRTRRGRHLRRSPRGPQPRRDRGIGTGLYLPSPGRPGNVADQRQARAGHPAPQRRRPDRAGPDRAGVSTKMRRTSWHDGDRARKTWVLEVVRGREPRQAIPSSARARSPSAMPWPAHRASTWRIRRSRIRRGGWPAGKPPLRPAGDMLSIRDLESPGGTFVNRQRLLSGQARALQPGDVDPAWRGPASRSTAMLPGRGLDRRPSHRLHCRPPRPRSAGQHVDSLHDRRSGGTCRTWDDFLTAGGPAVESRSRRADLGPDRRAPEVDRPPGIGSPARCSDMTADEQLDAWLARLPATRSSAAGTGRPSPDAGRPGGGRRRTGPSDAPDHQRGLPPAPRLSAGRDLGTRREFRIAPAFPAGAFQTIDQTDILIEIELPDSATSPSSTPPSAQWSSRATAETGASRFASSVRHAADLLPEASIQPRPIDLMSWGRPLGDRVASLSLARRLVLAPLALAAFRILVLLAGLIPFLPGAGSRRAAARARLRW